MSQNSQFSTLLAKNSCCARYFCVGEHLHVCTIYRIIQEGEKKRKRRGRPLKLSAKERRKIVHTFQQNPFESARGLSKRLNKSVSPSTIRRLLKVHGYRHAPVKISMILKPETVEKRLDFVREHVRKEEGFLLMKKIQPGWK